MDIKTIGRYRVERLLGSGAFASVWLAHDEVLDSSVAVKVLADNWARHLDVSERFLTEARLLRRADSERLVRVLDIGEADDGRPYFVMNLADGGSLEDRIDSHPLSLSDSLSILTEIAEAVCVLHEMDVVHRDLKPSNVLLQAVAPDRERVLLADLGLAKALAQGSGLTTMAGSPGYMAPEQQQVAGIVDERTDVYGLGALAHRLLTGELANASALDRLPRPIAQVVRRALRTDPAQRWSTMREFADRLRALSEQDWTGVRPPRRRRPVVLAAAALAVLAAGAGTWWLRPWAAEDASGTSAVAAGAGQPTPTPVKPRLPRCEPGDVDLYTSDPGLENKERMGISILVSGKQRTCAVNGRLEDLRFLRADGSPLPHQFVAGWGDPVPRLVLQPNGGAEASLSWQPGGETPARLEFRLPGARDLCVMPWPGGPVEGSVLVGPLAEAVG